MWKPFYWIYWLYAKGKGLLDYTDLFSPEEYENSDKIILKLRWKKNYIALFVVSIDNLKILKYCNFLEKH